LLERERSARAGSSIEKRIQKNLNSLTMEGTVAPALDLSEHLGTTPTAALADLNGDVLLLFFWAHWCSDCKAQSPILQAVFQKYRDRGLRLVAPTQRFGYVAGGREAPSVEETAYIDTVRQEYYPVLEGQPIPMSEANHRRYGVSSTPTLVLVDRKGIVRLYYPGRMTEAELDPLIRELLDEGA
jgi:thiol-disulfide isomerase/thioredoxin